MIDIPSMFDVGILAHFRSPTDHFLDIINTFPVKKSKKKSKDKQEPIIPLAEIRQKVSPNELARIDEKLLASQDEYRVQHLVRAYQDSELCVQNEDAVNVFLQTFEAPETPPTMVDSRSSSSLELCSPEETIMDDDDESPVDKRSEITATPIELKSVASAGSLSSLTRQAKSFSPNHSLRERLYNSQKKMSWADLRQARQASYNGLINATASMATPWYFAFWAVIRLILSRCIVWNRHLNVPSQPTPNASSPALPHTQPHTSTHVKPALTVRHPLSPQLHRLFPKQICHRISNAPDHFDRLIHWNDILSSGHQTGSEIGFRSQGRLVLSR